MQFVQELWIPILLSGLAVFLLSAISYAVLPFHRNEWNKLGNEDAVAAAIRAGNPAPGLYSIPFAGPDAMKDPAWQAKMATGPNAYITIAPPGMPAMPTMMGQSLLYNIVVSFFVAYVASHTVAAGAEYLTVFRVTGTVAFMAYVMSSVPDSIWFARPWKSLGLICADALVYGLVVGGIFGWRWV